ncbi:uncharacterized protein J8A68_002153 [[Candida] subhashii]|uniref:Uncharacterized protein n=1 Tax=[Candida] subhashii TaxID=561895 RepID=A0A8J5QE16_9ASCO|nr:uncharacterized protein J8A68_002153 [[Candida] subhashii]KAG7664334.1 hypothetical protein J8A68_002153 [[Candida] subhashii]
MKSYHPDKFYLSLLSNHHHHFSRWLPKLKYKLSKIKELKYKIKHKLPSPRSTKSQLDQEITTTEKICIDCVDKYPQDIKYPFSDSNSCMLIISHDPTPSPIEPVSPMTFPEEEETEVEEPEPPPPRSPRTRARSPPPRSRSPPQPILYKSQLNHLRAIRQEPEVYFSVSEQYRLNKNTFANYYLIDRREYLCRDYEEYLIPEIERLYNMNRRIDIGIRIVQGLTILIIGLQIARYL